ncbi:MAG: protecting protein DprA protein [Microgenomates group bacterium GW2011_GWA2_46_7]|nr:MAG: protecting protein DprA protein [Microgenomates group bacterium GW2011_GWA2_46_7]
MYQEMMVSGCLLVLEYPGITRRQTWTFPQRNRIVVGLTDLVVVGEAGSKSEELSKDEQYFYSEKGGRIGKNQY